MLFKELVENKRFCFHKSCQDWREAIALSCQPIIDDNSITKEYITSIINSLEKHGPYIVIAPHIAMPHAQEGAVGVNKTVISFMKVEEPVQFDENDREKDAQIFFVLASVNPSKHSDNMEKLANILLIDGIIEKLLEVKNEEDLLKLDLDLEGL